MPVAEKNGEKSPKGRPKKITEEIEQKITTMAREGKTNGEIAQALGLPLTTVRDARKRLAATNPSVPVLPRGARGPDKCMRKRRHKLQHGDKCPAWLYGVWPGSPEWPVDEEGNPLHLVGWDSCPPGGRLLQGCGWARTKTAMTDRAWDIEEREEEKILEKQTEMKKEDIKIHRMALECYQEDMERYGKRNTNTSVNQRVGRRLHRPAI
ncbi:MAG: helix-turn-helix transcriptional regulator [Thermacetogeniaceae bacterium]